MAEFDFAPRPPKQDDQDDASPFAAADPGRNKADKDNPLGGKLSKLGPFGQALQSAQDDQAGKAGKKGGFGGADARNAARRNPGESSGMMAGLMSMATTMGMARHTDGHIDPIGSPTGLLGMLKSSFGAKHEKSDSHSFDLDISRHGTAGGAIGGMSTGLGMVGGPLQAKSKRDSTGAAMKAIGGMARGTGGGLGARLGSGGGAAKQNMHWLDQGVKNIYKVDR